MIDHESYVVRQSALDSPHCSFHSTTHDVFVSPSLRQGIDEIIVIANIDCRYGATTAHVGWKDCTTTRDVDTRPIRKHAHPIRAPSIPAGSGCLSMRTHPTADVCTRCCVSRNVRHMLVSSSCVAHPDDYTKFSRRVFNRSAHFFDFRQGLG